MIIPNKMNIVPNTNIIIGLFIKCFFSFIIKNKSIIPSILYSINWILIFITSSYYLCLRNFFGWLSPYPIFLSFNFTRLLSLFSFLLPVLDLAIRPFPKSHLLFFVALIMLLLQPMPFSFLASSFSNFSFSLRSARSSLPAYVPFSLALSFAFIQASFHSLTCSG